MKSFLIALVPLLLVLVFGLTYWGLGLFVSPFIILGGAIYSSKLAITRCRERNPSIHSAWLIVVSVGTFVAYISIGFIGCVATGGG